MRDETYRLNEDRNGYLGTVEPACSMISSDTAYRIVQFWFLEASMNMHMNKRENTIINGQYVDKTEQRKPRDYFSP